MTDMIPHTSVWTGGALCHDPLTDPKNNKMYKQYSTVYTKCLI